MKSARPSMPSVSVCEGFAADPIAFLAAARAAHGDLFILQEGKPLFSRSSSCRTVLAVFGADLQRRVLSDPTTFRLPESAATSLRLPQRLVLLNRGLQSMSEDEHRRSRGLVSAALFRDGIEPCREAIADSVAAVAARLRGGEAVPMLATMRTLLRDAACRMLFGPEACESALGEALSEYFRLRRAATAIGRSIDDEARAALIAAGMRLDAMLRARIRAARRGRRDSSESGALDHLATAATPDGDGLGEDELVGHLNVLFMSMTEPVATALTWLLLILSQLPGERAALRRDLCGTDATRPARATGDRLHRLIQETLRLMPPNALMTRVTSRPTRWSGRTLAPPCEILLCPFLAHRDPELFPRPNRFVPARWSETTPSAYEYFPFGAGAHACIGQRLAYALIRLATAELLARVDPVLVDSRPIDWKIDIMLRPNDDIVFMSSTPAPDGAQSNPVWSGPVTDLLQLEDDAC